MFSKYICFSPEGLAKKSFALPYHGSTIWCEHLDSLGANTDAAEQKLVMDISMMARPSSPSAIAVVLDETQVSETLCALLVNAFSHQICHVQRLAFVGMSLKEKRLLCKHLKRQRLSFAVEFMNDLEMAKEWLIQ